MNNGIIFGGYAAYLWIKSTSGKELDYSSIDIFHDSCSMYNGFDIEDKNSNKTILRDRFTGMLINVHHVSPDVEINDVEHVNWSSMATRIESKKATKSRLEHDLAKYKKLVGFWKDFYPELPDIVHLSFEMDNIRNYLRYL